MYNNKEEFINPQYVNDAYEYLYDKGIVKSKSDLASKIDKDRSSVSRAFKGEEGYLNRTFLYRFNTKFGNIFNIGYLLNGEGNLLLHDSEGGEETIPNHGWTKKEINPAYLNEAYNYLRRRGVVLTQKELAEALGKGRTSVNKALNGNRSYLNESFLKWFNAKFGNIFEPEYLLNGEGNLLRCEQGNSSMATLIPDDIKPNGSITNGLPIANRNVKNLINQTFNGNITQFARQIGMSQQRVDRLFKTDPRSGKYPSVSEKMKNAIKKTFNIDDFWFYRECDVSGRYGSSDEDIFKQKGNNDNHTKEIEYLKEVIRMKDELIASKDNQIKLLEMIVNNKDSIKR